VYVGDWQQAAILHWKLPPNHCGQRHGYYWQPIGTCCIQWYLCRTPTVSQYMHYKRWQMTHHAKGST